MAVVVLAAALAVPSVRAEKLPPLPEGAFTYCVIPDTQRYLGEGAHVKKDRKAHVPTDGPTRNPAFESRVDWIVGNLAKERIFFVSHTGDIVDFKNDQQWSFASNLMTRLDGKVPYGISPGNHDVSVSGGDSTLFNRWFPRSRFEKYPWYAGAFERPPDKNGHYVSGGNANSCQLAEIDGHRFVFLHLECNAPADVLRWADGMLDRYAGRKAVICTHMCVGYRTKEIDMRRRKAKNSEKVDEWFGVMDWSKCHGERGVSGEEAWRTCFSKHANLILVVSGDQGPAISWRETRRGEKGNVVHLTLQDYPRLRDDDDWLRLYRFRKDMSAIDVYTYSPQQDKVCEKAGFRDDSRFHVFTLPLK